MTRHGLPQFPAAAPLIAADARVRVIPRQRRLRSPLSSVIPTGNAIRSSDNSDRSHHVPRLPTADRDFATLSRKQKYP